MVKFPLLAVPEQPVLNLTATLSEPLNVATLNSVTLLLHAVQQHVNAAVQVWPAQ